MLFKKNKYEVLITNNLTDFESAITVLKNNNIDYDTKLINNSIQYSHKGQDFYIKSRSESSSIKTIYYLYVSKNDFEEAKYLLNKL